MFATSDAAVNSYYYHNEDVADLASGGVFASGLRERSTDSDASQSHYGDL